MSRDVAPRSHNWNAVVGHHGSIHQDIHLGRFLLAMEEDDDRPRVGKPMENHGKPTSLAWFEHVGTHVIKEFILYTVALHILI